MYDKREVSPFPDVSICNLEPNLDDVIAVKDYLAKLDDIIAQNQEDIDVVNQIQGLKNKFALFQNLDNAPFEGIDKHFVAECFWITNKRLRINCSEYVSRLIYTGTFGQCYTFSTLLWNNRQTHGIYSMKLLLYLNQFQSGNSHLVRNKFHQIDQMNGGGKRFNGVSIPKFSAESDGKPMSLLMPINNERQRQRLSFHLSSILYWKSFPVPSNLHVLITDAIAQVWRFSVHEQGTLADAASPLPTPTVRIR